jgi:hypothetical protein
MELGPLVQPAVHHADEPALATYDHAERTKLYIEAQQLWDAEAGMAWVCSSDNYIGCAPYVKPSLLAHGGILVGNTIAI